MQPVMPQVSANEPRHRLPLRKAIQITDEFRADFTAYPHEDVRMRRGICKVLLEEYCPLVNLAQQIRCVRDVCLTSESNQGPDAEVRRWLRNTLQIQITCANQGYQRAISRAVRLR